MLKLRSIFLQLNLEQRKYYLTKNEEKDDNPTPETREPENDLSLWNRFQEGDEEAFVQIYEENFAPLFRYGSQFTLDRELIKDTIQDLFVDIRNRRSSLSISKIKPYLFISFKRRLIQDLKKHDRLSYTSENLEGYNFDVQISTERKMILDHEKMMDRARLKTSISNLTDRQREVIYYYYFENLSYNDIKQIMSFDDVKSVRNLLYKALKALRLRLLTFLLPYIIRIFFG